MSDQAKLKESLKKSIIALAMSAPMGLTVKEVEVDYSNFEGRPLPYRQLGYNTCQDFLQDIPDAVKAVWERGHLVVRAVADESTRHIQSLVSRQKVDVQKCLKRRRATAQATPRGPVHVAVAKSLNIPISASSSRQNHYRTGGSFLRQYQSRTSPSPGIAYNSRPRTKGPPSVQPSVPAYVRSQLKSFLNAHPNGVQSTHFDTLFAEKFGHTICFRKLGFESLVHMCQVLSDFVSLEKLGGGEFRIYDKSNYQRQGGNNPPQVNNSQSNRTYVESSLSGKQEASNCEQDAKPNRGPTQQITPQWKDSNATFQVSFGRPAGQTNIQPEHREAVNIKERSRSTSAESGGRASNTDASVTANSVTSDLFETKFLEEIQQVLADHPEGVWAAYLPDVYKEKFKKALPMMSLGYYSVTELMAAMPEVVVIEREQKQSDWKLYDIRTYQANPSSQNRTNGSSAAQSDKVQKKVSADQSKCFLELKKKIRQILEQNPEGVFLKVLPLTYKKTFHEPIPLEEHGFRDIDSLVMMMPDVVSVVYKGYGRLLLVLVKESSTLPRHKSFPDDAVGWGVSYCYHEFPPVQEYIEIYVATVFTPHRMCIQLKNKQSNEELDNLMDNLESVYAYPEGNKYEFPESMIAVGQVCCVLYLSDNNWHRGIITGIPKVDFVEVLYVDYGTVATVSRSSLRLLKSTYLRLPVQSFNARLAFIEPSEEKWTKMAKDRLLALTAGKPLIALITEIQKGELYLLLSDTTTEEDIHINDALVEEGLARFAGTLSEPEVHITPRDHDYQFSEDDLSESELGLLTLNDLVTDSEEIPSAPDDKYFNGYDYVEPARTQQGKDKKQLSSTEDVDAVNSHIQTPPPDLTTHTPVSQQATQSLLNNNLTSKDTDRGSNPSLDSEESKASDMPQLEESSDDGRWIVKCIDLDNGDQVHLINHDNEACLTVAEVASLICEDDSDPEDVLCLLVSDLGVEVPLLTAIEQEHPRLFRELRRIELLDSTDYSLDLITMIPFTSALLLLSSSGTVSMDAIQQLQEISEELGVIGDMFGTDVSDGAMDDLGLSLELEELNMTLETLQYKRKRILSAMMHNPDTDYVDELSHIERKIQEIRMRAQTTEVIIQERAFEADRLALKTVSYDQTSYGVDEHQVGSLSPVNESYNGLQDQSQAPGSPKPSSCVIVSADGHLKSPDRLVQAVEPIPRDQDTNQHGYPIQQHQPAAISSSQQRGQPPAIQNHQLTQPAIQFTANQNMPYARFPNPEFLPHSSQYFTPVHAQFQGASRYQHPGSGDFVPVLYPNQPPPWLGAVPQAPFLNQFPGTVLHGLPPRPFMANPQPGYCANSGGPSMPGEAPQGQGSWW